MRPALAPLEGKYEIVAKIKEGGMGAIYKVRHRLLEEVRVVKVLRRQLEGDADLNQRFIHEARAAIRLRHPNVVQIFDFLVEEGVGYIVMEYIDGVDLGELIQHRHRPSLPLFLEIAGQGLRALGYLHQKGFVHRDISPDNLMLTSDFAGQPLVKMIDLGIAKKVEGGVNLTASGMFLGKFRYSSPEHFGSRGAGGIEPRSDLYSYGVVLYEFLTGVYPILGDDSSQLIAGHLFHPPRSFDETDPGGRVPKALAEILLRALDKDPDKRFAAAADFAAALAALHKQFPLTGEALEEAAAARGLRAVEKPVEPGTTQSRLDRGFVHPTPAPPEEVTAAPDKLRRDQVTALLGGAEALRLLGQVDAARSQLTTVLELDPDNARARDLLGEIDGEPAAAAAPENEAGHELFDHHLHAACALADEGNYADAVPHFEAALELQSGNEAVRQMLAEAREKLEEERRVTEKRLASEIRQLEGLLESGDLEAARQRLLSARRAYGDATPLREVQRVIEREEGQRQAKQVEATLEEAAALRQAGKLNQAVQTLERARETWRAWPLRDAEEGRELLARLDREEDELENAHRAAAELAEAVYAVESAIADGRLVEADRVLFQAVESFGSAAVLQDLRQRLDHLHHGALEERIKALIDEAGRLAAKGEHARARHALDKARVTAPPQHEIRDAIEARAREVDAAEERWRAEQVEGARSAVEELLASHGPEQAQATLAAAEAALGDLGPDEAALFAGLRERIADAFRERVNALIHEAGVALEARRYRAAVPFLEQALELSPGDEWITARLAQARAALENPADPAAAADAIEGLIEAGKVDEADARLRQALERWGSNPELEGLELQLEAGRLAERNDASRGLAEEAEEAFAEGDLARARTLASRAVELSPMNAGARRMLERLERQGA